ncbi:MAG: AAA family ATPase [Candidatus Eremiobacteraeota bacterium]|nr:AAA family ATPase [Candidatus Eremiobacteraeota bacterium]
MSDALFDVAALEGPKRYFNTLSRDTIAHGYLFSGDAGVGKKTFARRLAQSLLCTGSKDTLLGYDGTCSSCVLFRASGESHHPDFFEHSGALKIGEADGGGGFAADDLTARDVVRQLSLQSYSGGLRVLLLGDVDFASPAAANALLKFLEEPPNGVVAILTTNAPERLLPTIRSRLVELRFPLLARGTVVDVLKRLGHSKAEAEAAAALAGGSVTRALATLDGDEESLRGSVARWFFESAAGRSPEQTWASRETLDEGLQTIKMLVRDWCVLSQGAAPKKAPADALLMRDYATELTKLPELGAAAGAELLAKIGEAQRIARTNVNPGMVSEIVRMAIVSAP